MDPTPLPAPVEPVLLLALLTRARAARVAVGELAAERLYDVRAFKCCYAELGYLRRLAAAGGAGGTVVTSMRQLVAGLAALHPAWEISGEGFEDRDRHQRAVRRRLADLQAMGLLRWRIGIDLDGEERRTELELRPAPDVSAEELQAAEQRMGRWQARYGKALNTGSRTGIRNAAGHGRPLSGSERQRRGCRYAQSAVAGRARVQAHNSNSAPPSGAPITSENTTITQNASEKRKASQRTDARAHNTQISELTIEPGRPQTPVTKKNGTNPGLGASVFSDAAVGSAKLAKGSLFDVEALVARVREREAQRRPVLEAIASQASARAVELVGWGLERAWPVSRLREAWVVARYGILAAADSGPSGAGPLHGEDYAQLRRAVARYERNRAARPKGYPHTGLGALLHLGMLAGAGELASGPRTLRYAVGALDQLSRRMRAVATADSAARAARAAVRARCRREPAPRALPLTFRAKWPPWVLLDAGGEPVFDRLGMLQLDPKARYVPPAGSDAYRTVIRDVYLLAGRRLPVDVDGRKLMALRHQRRLEPAQRRPARITEELELAELAHRTREPIGALRRLPAGYRQRWLARQRQEDAVRARAEMVEFGRRIADLYEQDR